MPAECRFRVQSSKPSQNSSLWPRGRLHFDGFGYNLADASEQR
jgi:hypothetical protein